MRRGLAALAVCLALAPATASAAERSLLVNGDRLLQWMKRTSSMVTSTG